MTVILLTVDTGLCVALKQLQFDNPKPDRSLLLKTHIYFSDFYQCEYDYETDLYRGFSTRTKKNTIMKQKNLQN